MGAEYNLKGPDECLPVAGFLAQQAVEKAIKGFLVLHRKRFTKTHNISDLLEIVAKVNPQLAEDCAKSDDLTDFATKYRYPEAVKRKLTKRQTDEAVKLAQESCARVLSAAEKK